MKPVSFHRSLLAVLLWVSGGLSALWAQASLPGGQVGVAYSYSVSTTPPPPAGTTYSAAGLPTGLSINTASGVVSGTPAVSGTFNGSISLTSGVVVNSFTFTLVIAPPASAPVISSATTLAGTVGTPISSYTVTATNSPTSFNVGALPPGLTLNSVIATAPSISGTPSVAGTYSVSLSANNAAGTGAVKTLAITIAPAGPVPVVGGTLSQSASLNQLFSYSISATESPASYSAVPLPLGLSLNPLTGVISGTPTVSGVYSVTLRATNNNGTSAPATLALTVGSVSVISSAASVNGGVGVAFAYQIAASNSPVSYNVSGLPAGLTADLSSGLISGTPTAAGVSTLSVSANNLVGPGPVKTVTLTVGNVPAITSVPTATGTTGTAFSFSVTGSNSPTSFAATGLPAGLSINSGTGVISGTPTTAGAATASLTATNASGTSAASNLQITISAPAGGGGGSGSPAPTAPSIFNQPVGVSVKEGQPASLLVYATGTAPLTYQWYKEGLAISGATSAFYNIAAAFSSDAGNYTVRVTNLAGSVTSSAASVAVSAIVTVPTITAQPASVTVAEGGSASLAVTATGTGPLTYQWRKDGVAIAGATGSGYSTGVAGRYTVSVGNSAGSVISDAAVVTLKARTFAGTFFGSFGGGGSFALYVRPDRTGVFLGYASASKTVLLSREVVVDATGAFQVVVTAGVSSSAQPGEPARAAADAAYTVSGRIGTDGTVSGAVSGLNLTLSAPAAASGATASLAGFYEAAAAGSAANSYVIIGAAGDVLVVTVNGATTDGGRGTVSASGVVTVTTESSATLSGNVGASAVSLTASTGGAALTYVGANADTRTDDEKLLNLSSRSQTGVGGQVLIAGFVISGSEPKSVLIRAIGPTLAAFGLNGALSSAKLEVFNEQNVSIKTGLDWGAAADAQAVGDAAARVGAFPLAKGSRDAAVLLTLAPGSYTAIVTGQTGTSGVCLVEAYDATVGSIPKTQRLINISSRALVGNVEASLIGGFVVTGSVPKRLLIRAVGPGLAQFGVPGVLAKPQLILQQNGSSSVLAQNAGYAGTPEAAAINAAAASVGAFPLPAGSADAAILINLAPGAYTAQVVGVGGVTGNALIEVYEVK